MPTPTNAATDPRNGLSDEILALGSYGVFMTCHNERPDWPNADQLTWTMMATNVVGVVSQAAATETDLPIPHLTALIHQWACGGSGANYFDLLPNEKLAWQAVAMFLANCLRPESQPSVPGLAKAAVEWYQRKISPKPAQVDTSVHLNGSSGNGELKPPDRTVNLVDVSPPRIAPTTTQGPGKGYSKTFLGLIDQKIKEYEDKKAALLRFRDKIGPDCDQALYEIIAPLLKEGD